MPKEENGRVPIQGEDGDEPLIIPGPHYYSLPRVRYVNIFITVILLEGLVSCILWLSGGDSEYFISSIADFSLKTSVFDIVLLSIVDVLFIALLLLPTLEKESYKKISEHHRNSTADKLLLFLLIFVCLAFFVFSCVKGGLILHCIQHDDSYTTMHGTYNGLVIVFCVFSFVKLCQALFGFFALRRLKKIRILHRFDEKGQEIDKDGKPLKKKVDLKRLFSLAIPEVGFLSLGCFTLLFSSAAQIVTPLYFGQVVDAAQKSLHDLVQKVLILLVVNLIGSVFAFVRSWVFTQAGMRLVARLRKKLFASIIEQEIAFFDSNRTGELCNRLSSDTQVLQNAVTVNVSMLFRYALQLIGSLGFMFYLNASLTGVLLAVVPIISVSAVVYGKYLRNYRQKFQDKLGEAGTMAEENISSIRTVRMFSAEAKARQLYDVEIDGSYKIGIKLSFLLGTFTGVIGVVMQGAICLALWYGGKLVYENLHGSHNGLTPGILTSFLLYTLQVAMAFSFMTSLYGDFMQAVGASIRIFHLLDRKPEVPNENGIILPGFKGDISFNEVQFTYPTRPETQVLKGVSFSLQPGEMLALVGPSGGGKSTIVNLLERFYDPEEGSIRLDDTDLKDLDPKWFRQRIAMVSQEPTLFCCSIRDNIAFGRTASDEEVIVAAKKANAHDFIIGFEKGYDTLVGERGVRLSGGQKQRIAIARALIMNPAVLLLDEATSALDAESEHLVQEAVDSAMKNRTVIVIAHRLSTVRNATKVIVIDKGKIAEEGTHEELLSRNGVYKRLVLRQLTAGTLATETSPNDDQNDNQNMD